MITSFSVGASSWIKLSQFTSLGITDEQLFFLVGVIGMIVSYYVFAPVVRLLVALQWKAALSYLISSLIFILVLGLYQISQRISYLDSFDLSNLANAALGIMFFGGVLIVLQITHNIISFLKQQRTKSM
ncbi:hypothetical protein [Aquibacillus kalidii]|uniref:hypothetical protein n=1 Tax=Aquibacillus kalidii TaxID=2762597 RepID=UPI001C99038E|nr:hypothetical protein [Aquibacillus kalidii]